MTYTITQPSPRQVRSFPKLERLKKEEFKKADAYERAVETYEKAVKAGSSHVDSLRKKMKRAFQEWESARDALEDEYEDILRRVDPEDLPESVEGPRGDDDGISWYDDLSKVPKRLDKGQEELRIEARHDVDEGDWYQVLLGEEPVGSLLPDQEGGLHVWQEPHQRNDLGEWEKAGPDDCIGHVTSEEDGVALLEESLTRATRLPQAAPETEKEATRRRIWELDLSGPPYGAGSGWAGGEADEVEGDPNEWAMQYLRAGQRVLARRGDEVRGWACTPNGEIVRTHVYNEED